MDFELVLVRRKGDVYILLIFWDGKKEGGKLFWGSVRDMGFKHGAVEFLFCSRTVSLPLWSLALQCCALLLQCSIGLGETRHASC